jgi:hypothetical protein
LELPVFKKRTHEDSANYRAVSLICILCKALNYVLCPLIRKPLDRYHGILTPAIPRILEMARYQTLISLETQVIIYKNYKSESARLGCCCTIHDILKHRNLTRPKTVLDFDDLSSWTGYSSLGDTIPFFATESGQIDRLIIFKIAYRCQEILCKVSGLGKPNRLIL